MVRGKGVSIQKEREEKYYLKEQVGFCAVCLQDQTELPFNGLAS